MIATVKMSFLRRSGVRNALRKAESKIFLLRIAAADGSGGGGRLLGYVRDGADSNSLGDRSSWSGGLGTETKLSADRSARRPDVDGRHGQAWKLHSYSWMAEPPAAAIFSLADALNACADTWRLT